VGDAVLVRLTDESHLHHAATLNRVQHLTHGLVAHLAVRTNVNLGLRHSYRDFLDAIEEYLRHRGSRRLAYDAKASLARLQVAISGESSGEDRKLAIANLLGECRFGYHAALSAWPGNEGARQGLDLEVSGTIYLGGTGYIRNGNGAYITYGANGSSTPSTIRQAGAAITITLGTASGTSYTNTTAASMTWTPSSSATDIAGNADTLTTATQSGSRHINF